MAAEQKRQVGNFIGQEKSEMELQQAQAVVQMIFECHTMLEGSLQKSRSAADGGWKEQYMEKFSKVH